MPERVLRILRHLGGELTAEELVDVLWLADRVPAGEGAPLALALERLSHPSAADGPDPAGDHRVSERDASHPSGHEPAHGQPPSAEVHAAPGRPEPAPGSDAPPEGADDTTDAEAPEDTPPSDGPPPDPRPSPEPARALPIRVPYLRSLSTSLVTARALRPLKQYRPDPGRAEVDETATVTQIAHTGIVDLVTRPLPERWLDLALVVDDGPSMLLWQQLCSELRALFERLGAFRRIHVKGLRLRTGQQPMLTTHPFGRAQDLIRPGVLADPSGRTMVLVVSDGAGPGWHGDAMRPLLARWAAHGPTAVVHALPPRMWRGSGLSARRWSVRSPHPGAANTAWRIRDTLLPPELSSFHGTAVPVLEPTPRELAAWVRMTVSTGASTVLPLWDATASALDEPDGGTPPEKEARQASPGRLAASDGSRAVRQFRRIASPDAYRLAAHLAAISPLTVPVMSLVVKAVPWPATTAHLAEVFLGGLMHIAETEPHAQADLGSGSFRHGHRVFSFSDEARDVLLDAVPTAQVIETTRRVSRQITQLAGRSPDFPAWLNRPDGTDPLPEHTQGFAWLGAAMLRRLGLTGLSTPEWGEAPPVPEEAQQSTLNSIYPKVPFVGYSPAPPRRALPLELPYTDSYGIANYALSGRAPGRGPNPVYLGRSEEGVKAAVRVANRELTRTEVVALSRLSHDCLPSLLDYDATGGPHGGRWTAVSLVSTTSGDRAPDLAELVRTTGPLGVEAALCLGQRLAGALLHSHSAGVVHGRLAPDRILVTESHPVIVGWQQATVDGQSPGGDTAARTEADDLRALAALVIYAAYGPERTWQSFSDFVETVSAQPWNLPEWSNEVVDSALRMVVRTCLYGESGAVPTAVPVLSLLRDRLPRDTASRRFSTWLSPLAVNMLDGAVVHRTAPSVVGQVKDAGHGAQVPLSGGRPEPEARLTIPPHPGGQNVSKWLRLPGTVPPPSGRRGRLRRPRPEPVLGPGDRRAPAGCVVVIGPHRFSGRSTVAVQLASALAARTSRRKGPPVVMLPVDERMGVFGYRLSSSPATPVSCVVGPVPGQVPPSAGRWVTLTDSSGAHFLYAQAPEQKTVRYNLGLYRRGLDWVRALGTTVVDAAGSFIPPDTSLRALLGAVDHLVMATTPREEHLEAARNQLDWLAKHGYLGLVGRATAVLSDLDGTRGTGPAPGDVVSRLGMVRHVRCIPHDPALRDRGPVDHADLAPDTRRAFDMLARDLLG
ncbi:SAV_2336 N-terminal domain-related protein [Streptomyces coffeae]|uniref:Protein kinase domain-containing protein n=1 Tax=Streptomyces coffeae TaxID=621382 RepID=A0ABS1NNT0_9ACTN|nr:SAV_2336 N-terminal domain-related protein [Streptomyces coffeae]MBL1101751.1 hypothetical protein [Streptomyces coffeae]